MTNETEASRRLVFGNFVAEGGGAVAVAVLGEFGRAGGAAKADEFALIGGWLEVGVNIHAADGTDGVYDGCRGGGGVAGVGNDDVRGRSWRSGGRRRRSAELELGVPRGGGRVGVVQGGAGGEGEGGSDEERGEEKEDGFHDLEEGGGGVAPEFGAGGAGGVVGLDDLEIGVGLAFEDFEDHKD